MRTLVEKLEEKYVPEPNTGCWLWFGVTSGKGYGAMQVNKQQKLAHRVSWEIHYGPIPKGICVLHKCDTPLCVNPAHLFLGTKADNMADRDAKGRTAKGENNGRAKLAETQAAAIREDPRSLREIASDYGVHYTAIGKIKRRERWKHIL